MDGVTESWQARLFAGSIFIGQGHEIFDESPRKYKILETPEKLEKNIYILGIALTLFVLLRLLTAEEFL